MSKSLTKSRGRPVKHGIKPFFRTGKINPSVRGHRRLQQHIDDMERALIDAKGGLENITPAQEILIRGTVQAYGYLLLSGAYTKKYSILRPDQARRGVLELQPVLAHQYIAFSNTIRQNLVALGIENIESERILPTLKFLLPRPGNKRGSDGKRLCFDFGNGEAQSESGQTTETDRAARIDQIKARLEVLGARKLALEARLER